VETRADTPNAEWVIKHEYNDSTDAAWTLLRAGAIIN
jgi:hypothetical protein